MTLGNLETARICRELALLTHAGIALADGVFLLAKEAQSPFQDLLDQMGEDLDKGLPLSDAMAQRDAFASYAVTMVRLGEEAGKLEESLELLADYYEERHRVNHRIRSAVAYPGMVLMLMLMVVGVLLIKVVPVFDRVYGSLGSRLTGAAAGLLYLGQGLERVLPCLLAILLLFAAGALVLWFSASLRKKARFFWQSRFGDRGIGRKFSNARFARAMAMGLGSGLHLDAALELAQQVLTDTPGAARRCAACAQTVKNGTSFREAVEAADLLPPALCRMLALGIRSGNADQIMETIAKTMMEDAQSDLDAAIGRIEPAMVLVSSLLVGLILLCVMLPLMDILAVLG